MPLVGSSIAGHAEGKINELERMPTETYQQKGKEKEGGRRRRSVNLGTVSKGGQEFYRINGRHQTTDPGSSQNIKQAKDQIIYMSA